VPIGKAVRKSVSISIAAAILCIISAGNFNRIAALAKVNPADLFSKTDEPEALKVVKSQQE